MAVVGGGDDIVTHGMLRPKQMIRTSNLHSSAIKTLRMRTNPKTFVQQIITTTNLIQSVHDILRGAGLRNSLIHSATRSVPFCAASRCGRLWFGPSPVIIT